MSVYALLHGNTSNYLKFVDRTFNGITGTNCQPYYLLPTILPAVGSTTVLPTAN